MPSPTSLAPGYVRCTYDGQLFPHHMTIPVNFSGTPVPGSEPDLILKDSSTLGAESAIAAMFALITPYFSSSIHFGLAEAHTVDSVTGEDQFIYAWNQGLVGSSGLADIAMSQIVFTFKTALGTIYKLYLLEGRLPPNYKELPPYSIALFSDLSDFIVGDTSPVYGRGNSYPFVPVSLLSKTNDKLRKQQGLA